MQITGASYTAVNRRITEGRRTLRKRERARESASDSEPRRDRTGRPSVGHDATAAEPTRGQLAALRLFKE